MRTKQKILQLSKERLQVISFAIFFNVLLAGSVCGTFAWYTYATRTGFEDPYHGTTVGDVGSLDIGLVSNIQLSEHESYELTEDAETLSDEGKYIYWCNSDPVQATTINYVLNSNGSATTTLHPVTSGAFDMSSDPSYFHLYRNPHFLDSYAIDAADYAEQTDYVFIPFVFRYEEAEEPGQYVADKEIFLSKCNVETDVDGKEIYKSVRVFTSNNNKGYLINPTADADGKNDVGGILDLNKDGFYDFDDFMYEKVYGEYEYYEYLSTPTEESGTLSEEETNSFVSNHRQGIYAVNEENFVPKTVSYKCMKQFADKEQSVSITDGSYHNLACLNIYVYSEGWDLHVIDQEEGAGFNLDLSFEVKV